MNEEIRLSYERTIQLIAMAKNGDEEAMETLVRCNIALVRSIVKKYINRGVEYEDLYQIGSMGLVKAVKNFDPAYNVRFSTYAVPMIAGEIKRYLRDDGMIKVSRSLKELAGRAAIAHSELSSKLGRDPGIRELAEYMGEDAEEIAMAMDASRPHVSIYEPAFGDDGDTMVMDKLSVGGQGEDEMLDRVLLQQLIDILDPREQRIIMLRYFRGRTQSEIAASMGISQVQVSRLESRIMKKLKERAAEQAM